MQLKFPTPEARTAFVTQIQQDDPDLFERVKPSYSQPTVIALPNIGGTMRQRLERFLASALGKSVKVFEDFQFAPLK